MPETPSPGRPVLADLTAHRARRERVSTATAAAPVRYLPAELLEALMGAWGTPEELGLRPARPHLQAVGHESGQQQRPTTDVIGRCSA